ncbi:MAG: strawberry notch family protein [Sphingomonadaceae bacterium]|nr:strawberry notch family protein [Sphingomonadaceae bacterium]
MSDSFNGSDADGSWSAGDANTACELAQALWLSNRTDFTARTDPAQADRLLSELEGLVPAQVNRSETQVELQQFATPPRLAWLAARACAFVAGDKLLEPSAGTGLLALWGHKGGAELWLNEFSSERATCLASLFRGVDVTRHDGELIDQLLDHPASPSLVLMNPPYSVSAERGRDGRCGSRHLRSAFCTLRKGGRLVAIMPEWFDVSRFVKSVRDPVAVRLNACIEGAFRKSGTSIAARLFVLDKCGCSKTPVLARTNEFSELVQLVDALPERESAAALPRLIAQKRFNGFSFTASLARSVPTPPRRGPAAGQTAAVSFEVLGEAAPLAEQVGHYLPYRPSRIVIAEACPHPAPLVESVAMGSIAAPKPSAVPELPDHLIIEGILSAAQIETLIYAASAHERDIPGTFEPADKGCSLTPTAEGQAYRMGYFLGDGTGAGKGRQLASIILDRWVRGERRHIWISKNEALLEDARRDWGALGGLPLDVQPLQNWRPGQQVSMPEGILFVTYPTLRSGRADMSRLEQILAWAGCSFDGVLIFDEAHAMAGAAGGESARGKSKGSEQGVAGIRLQNLLPRARVVYASATGASDVNNLAYAIRLGLWGPHTAFPDREAFVAGIRDGGIAAMELVARDLKALGLYTSRALSFAGVEYEVLEHRLTEEQIAIYDAYAQAWAIIHANLKDALEATRIVDGENGDTLNSGAKASALSVFEGTKQRFFAQLLLSMKLPSLLPAIEAALTENMSVVIQLVSTSEAMLERRLAELSDEEREQLEIDLSPREYVIDYLTRSFPVRLMAVFVDENGTPRSEPMSDQEGNAVLCRSALAARERMIEQLCALPPIATALDALIERFGTEHVAEVTGRSRRLVIGPDGKQQLRSRSPRANLAETRAFMDGEKRILVFSDAGGTGRSYHAALDARNQQRRVHFLLEPGWRADAAIQGLGRTNRTNQASAPLFRPVTTDVRGERRFISTIARRLDSLGALTRGQRQTGGQNLFDPADNLESSYAKEALSRWFGLLFAGKLQAVTLERFQDLSGLKIASPDGSMVENLPTIQRWLNRILALPITLQNAIFDEYLGLVEARVDAAREAGTLDVGVETIPVESFSIISDTLLRTDDQSGATTHLLEVEISRTVRPLTLERLRKLYGLEDPSHAMVRNMRSGRVALRIPARSILNMEGERVARFDLIRPLKRLRVTADEFEESAWAAVGSVEFCKSWSAEVNEAASDRKCERLYLATGLLLPIWDKLPADHVRVSRIASAEGCSLLGREVPAADVPGLCRALGLNAAPTSDPGQLAEAVLSSGKPMDIPGIEQLTIKRSLVNGSQRLELVGWSAARLDWYKAQGCFTEIIRYKTRLFVPRDHARAIIDALAASRA